MYPLGVYANSLFAERIIRGQSAQQFLYIGDKLPGADELVAQFS